MIEKYFLHRIQRESGTFTKGIEIHDTLDSAILAYDGGIVMQPYKKYWEAEEKEPSND